MTSSGRPSLWPCLLTSLAMGCGCAAHARPKITLSHEMAEVMVAHGAYETALPLVQKSIAEDPDNARSHLLLGMMLRDRRLLPEARRELDHAWRLDPADCDTAAAMGTLLDMDHDGESADVWHRRAIVLSGGRAEHHNNLGFSLSLRGEYTGAIAAYRHALERDPGMRRVYNNLGFAQARLGLWSDAWASFQQAAAPGRALSNFALAHELAGDLSSARAYYAEALRVDGKLKIARRNLDKLNALALPGGPRAEKERGPS